ncbi:interleukin binding protein [Turkeypox virus]|uniref:Interleukin binding protein n=1 Tax=Turkeypox virus TaxID=336486 RepID=A0A0M3PBB5_9POXV|nr:interleukin binding protein [Turkeypox virus]ALA62530.1 interleukin binding protein [Turkeypox virus]
MFGKLVIISIFILFIDARCFHRTTDSCCTPNGCASVTVNITNAINDGNNTVYTLQCMGCTDDEDFTLLYWMHNGTFPEKLDGMKEGSTQTTTTYSDDSVILVRELNVTSSIYLGLNFSCVLISPSSTIIETILLHP